MRTQQIHRVSRVVLILLSLTALGTADWRQPWRSVRPLVIAVGATVLAFAGLYYLEHFR
jgi:hypothetical protein